MHIEIDIHIIDYIIYILYFIYVYILYIIYYIYAYILYIFSLNNHRYTKLQQKKGR